MAVTIITPSELAQYLAVIKASGAAEFHWGEFHVRFVPEYAETVQETLRPSAVKAPTSIWQNPSLWPGGVPPKFPTKE